MTENRSFFELCSLALATRTSVHCRHQHDDDALQHLLSSLHYVITKAFRPMTRLLMVSFVADINPYHVTEVEFH